MTIGRVALIGAGTIGRQSAGFLAAEGIPATLYDIDREALKEACAVAKDEVKARIKNGLSSPKKGKSV